MQTEIGSITRKGNILRGRQRNGDKQSLVYTAETVHLNNLFSLALGIKILFFMKQIGHCHNVREHHFIQKQMN